MELIDFGALAVTSQERRPVWSGQSADLNLNLVVLQSGTTVEEHRNEAVDLLLIAFAGKGRITVDDGSILIRAGQGLIIPKGAKRSIVCDSDRFAYLLCHRRRGGLWPSGPDAPAQRPPEGKQ